MEKEREISFSDLMKPMDLHDCLFGKLRDLRDDVIHLVMVSVLKRQPNKADLKDFEILLSPDGHEQILLHKGVRAGSFQLKEINLDTRHKAPQFEWEFKFS